MKNEKEKEIKDFEKWRIKEELTLQILIGLNKSIEDFKSTTIEGYKPTNKDINSVLSTILSKRLNR